MKTPYDDIINLPHHVSRNHPQMPMRDRAAQFSPFAALTGYEDAIDETGRLTEQRRELDATEQAELNRRFEFLASHLAERPEVSIEYFIPDERKTGGSYQIISGIVRKLSIPKRTITLQDGGLIHFDDISAITGPGFDGEESL